MSKKTRPVLYEVLRRRAESRPQWRPQRPRPAEPESSVGTIEPSPSPRTFAPSAQRPELWRMLGNRVDLSLSVATLAGAGVGLIVLLIVAFQVGRYSAGAASPPVEPNRGGGDAGMTNLLKSISPGSKPSDSGSRGLREPERVAINVPKNPAQPEGEPAPAKPREEPRTAPQPEPEKLTPTPPQPENKPTLQLVKGRSYVQIQCFRPRDRQAAEDAAAFLIQNGVPCGIQERRDDIVLWATEAFDLGSDSAATRRAEQQRAKQLESKIKQIGDAYFKLNGKYRFKEANIRSAG